MTEIPLRPRALPAAALALLAFGTVLLWPRNDPDPAAGPTTSSISSQMTPDPSRAAPWTATRRSATPPGAPATSPSGFPSSSASAESNASSNPAPARSAPTPTDAAGDAPGQTSTQPEAEPLDEAPPDPADALAGGAESIAVDPTSKAGIAAIARATAFTTAYAHPASPDQHRWWAAVTPHLSPQAVLDYEGVLAAGIPFSHVTGAPRFSPLGDGSERVVLVDVPTDAGFVRVHLLPDEAREWVVTRAEMPTPLSSQSGR